MRSREMVRFLLDLAVIFLTVLIFAALILAENAVTH